MSSPARRSARSTGRSPSRSSRATCGSRCTRPGPGGLRAGSCVRAVIPANPRPEPVAEPGGEPIAVVLTVLDDREHLAETLAALERQEHAPDELVVVDGGS